MQSEACPSCGYDVCFGDEHEPGCEYEDVGADGLRERKDSWDRQARYDGRRR